MSQDNGKKPNGGLEVVQKILERFGVADDAGWMAVVLFARNLVAEMDLFTEGQKAAMQSGLFVQMGKKPLDQQRFHRVIDSLQGFLLDNSKVADLRDQLKAEREGSIALYSEVSRVVHDIQASSQARESSIKRLGADTEQCIVSGGSKAEVLQKLRGMITEMVGQAREEARTWEERARQMERTANFDPLLSELFSRRALDAKMSDAVERAKLDGRPLSFMFLDVDHFKSVNDTFGHVVGDGVLRVLASIVSAHAMQFGGYAARFGGEELVVLCEGLDEAQALVRAEALRLDVARCPFVPQCDGPGLTDPISITVSIGVAQLDSGQSTCDLVLAADQAMYGAKTGGRNLVVTHSTLPQVCKA